MAKIVHVNGYDEFKLAQKQHEGKPLFAIFSGSSDETGNSWCPDCVQAEPVVNASLSKLPNDAVFIHCSVGDRAFWKNSNNVFRKDPELKLTCVPTLLKIGKPHRLLEEQCANSDLVELLFTDD